MLRRRSGEYLQEARLGRKFTKRSEERTEEEDDDEKKMR